MAAAAIKLAVKGMNAKALVATAAGYGGFAISKAQNATLTRSKSLP